MVIRKVVPAAAPRAPKAVAPRDGLWESESALQPLPAKPFDPTEQPRLYADLLAEADRRRRAADDRIVQSMVAPRYGDL